MRSRLARLLYRLAVHLDASVEPTVAVRYATDGLTREGVEAHVRRSLAYAKGHYGTAEARERFNRPGWYGG